MIYISNSRNEPQKDRMIWQLFVRPIATFGTQAGHATAPHVVIDVESWRPSPSLMDTTTNESIMEAILLIAPDIPKAPGRSA
jgi:hypothetical protein